MDVDFIAVRAARFCPPAGWDFPHFRLQKWSCVMSYAQWVLRKTQEIRRILTTVMELEPRYFASLLWGSSPRPYAYEAHALPTELRRQLQLIRPHVNNNSHVSIPTITFGDLIYPATKPHIPWGWNVSLSFKNTSYPSPHPACSANTRMQLVLPPSRSSSTALEENSATGTRTWVARVRAEYPNQLDYSGHVK